MICLNQFILHLYQTYKNLFEKEKWSLVRYLHAADHNPKRITKAHRDFAQKLDFKDVKFSVKVRDIHKI